MLTRLRQSMLLGLSMLLGTSGCQMTMTELKALNPSAATLEVHCHPSTIPEQVQRFALHRESGHIVTDEQQDELRSYAPLASVFIEVNPDAPIENARIMASEYGLSCPNMVNVDESSSESLFNNARYVAQPEESSAGSGATALPRIAVCARPSGITGNEWYGGPGINGTNITNAADHAKELAKATITFIFDANAPPESIWNFGPDTKIRCPGKAPIPYDQWVAANSGTASQQSGSTNAAAPASPTTASTTPKTGSAPPSSASSPDGKGPPLDPIEAAIRELAIAGALAQGDTSSSLKDANGARHGIPGGKNVGGFSFPPLQAGVALIQIVSAVGQSPKSFVNKVAAAARKGQRTMIKELDESALKLADELIEKYGKDVMVESLRKAQVIMPFKMGQKFTAGLEAKFQAHKIFERQAFKDVLKLEGKALEEAVKKAPSIILTDAQHKVINAKLAAAWKANPSMSKKDLREVYKIVYQENPHWMDAIESFLR